MPTPYLVRRPPCLGLPCCRDHQRRPRRPRCRSAPLDSPFQVCSESLRPLHPPFPGQGPLAPFPHTSPSFFLPSLAPAPSLRVSPLPPPPTLTLSSPASLSLRLLLSPPSPSSGRPKADAADCSTSAPARAARPPPPQQQQQQQQQAPPQQQQQQQQLAAGGGSPRLRPGNHRLGPAGALGGGVSSRPI
jgi:hypothetical protein